MITSGGASVGEADHAASALTLAGGSGETLRIALKPGKPAVVGRIGAAAFLVTTVIGLTGLWPAILADTGATVLVTINALRLLALTQNS